MSMPLAIKPASEGLENQPSRKLGCLQMLQLHRLVEADDWTRGKTGPRPPRPLASRDRKGKPAHHPWTNDVSRAPTASAQLLLRPGLAQLLPEEALPATTLRRRFDQLNQAIEQWLSEQKFVA
jgi:hypothetical protein